MGKHVRRYVCNIFKSFRKTIKVSVLATMIIKFGKKMHKLCRIIKLSGIWNNKNIILWRPGLTSRKTGILGCFKISKHGFLEPLYFGTHKYKSNIREWEYLCFRHIVKEIHRKYRLDFLKYYFFCFSKFLFSNSFSSSGHVMFMSYMCIKNTVKRKKGK